MPKVVFRELDNAAQNEDFLNAIQNNIDSTGKFESFTIEIDSEHASYVEYGTGAAIQKTAETDAFGQSVMEKIERWVTLKFAGNLTKRQRKDMAYSVYKKIMQEGMAAKPFIRPAIIDTLYDVQTLNSIFANSKEPMLDVARYIVTLMKENLEFHDSIYTHELINSIRIAESPSGQFTNEKETIEDAQSTETIGTTRSSRGGR